MKIWATAILLGLLFKTSPCPSEKSNIIIGECKTIISPYDSETGSFIEDIYYSLPDSISEASRMTLLAQAIVETGWGKSSLYRLYNNCYGIKGKGIVMKTFEFDGDIRYDTTASFKKYGTLSDCIAHRIRILGVVKRYSTNSRYWNLVYQVEKKIKKDLVFAKKIIYYDSKSNQSLGGFYSFSSAGEADR